MNDREMAQMLRESAAAIRLLKQTCVDYETKLAHFQREEEIAKIASVMQAKGLNSNLNYEEKVASLRLTNDLQAVKAAVDMAGNNTVNFGSVSNANFGEDHEVKSITDYILGKI